MAWMPRAGWEMEWVTRRTRCVKSMEKQRRKELQSKSEPSSPVRWPDERKSAAQSSNWKRSFESDRESLCRLYPCCINPRCKYYPCWTMTTHNIKRSSDSSLKKRHKFGNDAESKLDLKPVDSATTSPE